MASLARPVKLPGTIGMAVSPPIPTPTDADLRCVNGADCVVAVPEDEEAVVVDEDAVVSPSATASNKNELMLSQYSLPPRIHDSL